MTNKSGVLGRVKAKASSQATSYATWAKRGLVVAVIGLAAFLIYRTLSNYSVSDITQAIARIPLTRLLLAGAFAAGSYFCLSWFDWLGLRYAGKPLPYRMVALASFCSLSLGHNIGFAALSSGAIRYRFYSRWGLRFSEIAKVILFCAVTVLLGLATLAGLALLLRSDLATKITGLSEPLAFALGLFSLALPVCYVALTPFVRGTWEIRGWSLQMPEPKLAMAQVGIGVANFACVAACLHQLLTAIGEVSYLAVATTYVIANATALIAHVPGGLGVIESVVLLLLPGGGVIGALVMFRVIYFLIPLCIGGPLFGATELYFRSKGRRKSKGRRRTSR